MTWGAMSAEPYTQVLMRELSAETSEASNGSPWSG
jgi:hypothetical protein